MLGVLRRYCKVERLTAAAAAVPAAAEGQSAGGVAVEASLEDALASAVGLGTALHVSLVSTKATAPHQCDDSCDGIVKQ
jgi:hypothetical protein